MRKVINISLWGFSIVCLIVIMGFVDNENKNSACKSLDIRINYEDENFFVEKEDIISMIENEGIKLEGKPLFQLNYEKIETFINANTFVTETEVYSTIDGELIIDIIQRNPIIRIKGGINEMDFYLDEQGEKMSLSQKFTSRVLIANGNVNTQNLDDIFTLAKFVNRDSFWKAQIHQIYIDPEGEFQLIPRVGRQKIILGDVSDLEEKLNKLMIFYTKGLKKVGWDKYKTINLKYKNQVVCTKI